MQNYKDIFLFLYHDNADKEKLQDGLKKYLKYNKTIERYHQKINPDNEEGTRQLVQRLEQLTNKLLPRKLPGSKASGHESVHTVSIIGHLPYIKQPAKVLQDFINNLSEAGYILVILDDNKRNIESSPCFKELCTHTGGAYHNMKGRLLGNENENSSTAEILYQNLKLVMDECLVVHHLCGQLRDELKLHCDKSFDKRISKEIMDTYIPKAKDIILKRILPFEIVQQVYTVTNSTPNNVQVGDSSNEVVQYDTMMAAETSNVQGGDSSDEVEQDDCMMVTETSNDNVQGGDSSDEVIQDVTMMDTETSNDNVQGEDNSNENVQDVCSAVSVNTQPIQDTDDFLSSSTVFISDLLPFCLVASLLQNSSINPARMDMDLTDYVPDNFVHRCVWYVIGQSTYEHSDVPQLHDTYSFSASQIFPSNRCDPTVANTESNLPPAVVGAQEMIQPETIDPQTLLNSDITESPRKPSESTESTESTVTYIQLDLGRRFGLRSQSNDSTEEEDKE